ncbi:FecR family protein [Mucilaginibacter paludis]|uniref:Anti-FecI sigma factor, FecR n=1 Tax=Mucilaginibacter paludis DSM 18603 TaxID=714943 RepID=H1Y989_9SPHI|nr:FecR family protein [Mucilaginibacter paludis]EHQ29467.1 anti-FecI sigma factor, FecR [Mucilaginibacter paludis DSM 18603]
MSYEKAKELLTRYKDGTATDEEKATVEKLLFSYNDDPLDLSEERYDKIIEEVWDELPKPATTFHRFPAWTKVAAAASVIIGLSAALYFIKLKPTQQMAQNQVHDIGPGSNKLILTLGNGKKIDLTAAKNGQIAKQGQAAIRKVSNGKVIYAALATGNEEIQFNTVSAPTGGTGAITLSDGTEVWLNAASSITFPTVFKGNCRSVSTTGDVIIKPRRNAKMPFYTTSRGQTTEDFGTEFEINAYDNEPVVKTTLIEGSVSIAANGKKVMLKPGQQSILSGNQLKVEPGNIRNATAWRDGELRCDGENIQTIMRMIERWYDVDVVYEGKISTDGYYGTISRYKNISQALRMLSYSNQVHFKVEGRRITVTK